MGDQHRDAAISIVRRLQESGQVAYFAGGCVRDELLGATPKDYDVATDASPKRIEELFQKTRGVGRSFGVMQVRARGVTTEVATFRKEGVYTDRRRPDSVEFTDAEHDAMRRDFTINALFLDPMDDSGAHIAPAGGSIIDFVGGWDDLQRGVIRAVGDADARLREDDLRALRAVRFSSRLGFAIEDKTRAAIVRHAGDLCGVSTERIGDEMRLMLGRGTRQASVQLLETLGLDGVVLRSQASQGSLDVLGSLGEDVSFAASLAAWLVDRQLRHGALRLMRETIETELLAWRSGMCLSNAEQEASRRVLVGDERRGGGVADLVPGGAWDSWDVARRKRGASSDWFPDALSIVRALDGARATAIEHAVRALSQEPGGLGPEPIATGDDLIRAGFAPGVQFGSWLERLYDMQLRGEIRDLAEALRAVRRWSTECGENAME